MPHTPAPPRPTPTRPPPAPLPPTPQFPKPAALFFLCALLGASALGAQAAPVCPGATHPLAAPAGTPSALALAATSTTASARVYVADTVARVCRGYVGTSAGKWRSFVAVPSVTYAKTADSASSRAAAVAQLVARLTPGPVPTPAPVDPTPIPVVKDVPPPAPTPTPAPVPTPSPTPIPLPPPTPVPAPSPSPASLAAVPFDSASFRLYAQHFGPAVDKLWAQDGPNWGGANYYDRAHAYSEVCRRGLFGYDRSAACQRADTMAVNYRVGYLEASKCSPTPYWAQMDGIWDHWVASRARGDTAAASADARAILCVAKNFEVYLPSPYFVGQSNGDPRLVARSLKVWRLARRLSVTTGDSATAARFAKDETTGIGRILTWQKADGSLPQAQTCNGDLNYMDGMLLGDLTEMQRDHYDARADTIIVKAARYLLTQMRLDTLYAGQRNVWSVNYASVTCATGSPTPAPDLNMDFTRGFLTAARLTGDPTFLVAADRLFASGVRAAYLAGSKQFNESYNPDALVFYLERPTP